MTRNNPPAARDTDKMIRQLSLVAYLMSRRGRRVDAETVRWNVEGYGDEDQNWDAFTRRFYADREELAQLGIEVLHEQGEFGEGELYWLPPENYFLPAVEFSRDELAALGVCLSLLDGQFAYSRLLRLALQGLALGVGGTLEDPASSCFSVDLHSSGYDETLSSRQREIENAISRRKTIRFDYYAMSSDSVETRTVDPYGMMVTRGDWYLVGHSHERAAIRIFKLRRIQGRIRMFSRNEHDFERPEDFRIGGYLILEPWQLGECGGSARISISPRMGWWARNNLAASGRLESAADGAATLTTEYSDGTQLCALVLGLGEDAMIDDPPRLRQQLLAILDTIHAVHSGAPPAGDTGVAPPAPAQAGPDAAQAGAAAPGAGAKREARRPDNTAAGEAAQVPPERFAQLATTISYLMDRLGGAEQVTLPTEEVCRDLGFAGEKELIQAVDLLRLVSTGAGGYLVEAYVRGDTLEVTGWPEGETLRKPARLSPREARAMLLAIDLVGSQILGGHYESLKTARGKIQEAAGGFEDNEAIAVGETEKEDFQICRVINQGVTGKRLVQIEYLSRSAAAPVERLIEPYLVKQAKGQWYLDAWCREKSAMRTFRFEMIKSARLLPEEFEPREPETLGLAAFTADPRFPSGKKAPHTATIRFSPELARWVRERNTDLFEGPDGSLIGRIPYFDEGWIVSELLKYCGEAELLAPAPARQKVARTAKKLARRYT